MKSTHDNENDDDDELSVKDKEVRKHIKVLTSRLSDLRERFMKIVENINTDANEYADQISDDEITANNEESSEETSTDEEDESADVNDENKPTGESLVKCILESKARRHKYLKHLDEYPKIMKYILNDDPNCLQIPLRHLEPFIIEYVDDNPTGKIYDKITQQIQDIRQIYLKNNH